MRNFLLFIGIIMVVFGIKFVYDARPIVKKYFGFGDKNVAVGVLKILGFILAVIGVLLLVKYLN